MVRKSKRIQSIQSQSNRSTKPRAAPLSTITTSHAPSSHTPTSPTFPIPAPIVEADTADDALQHGVTPVAPERTPKTRNHTSALDQSTDGNSVEKISSARATKRKRDELKEQEDTTTTLSRNGALGSIPPTGQLETDVPRPTEPRAASLTRTVSMASSTNAQPPAPTDPTFELLQTAVSSVILTFSSQPSSDSQSNPDTTLSNPNAEAREVILSTAPALIAQLELLLCAACYERISALEKERNESLEELERDEEEREKTRKQAEELEESERNIRRSTKKTRFAEGC